MKKIVIICLSASGLLLVTLGARSYAVDYAAPVSYYSLLTTVGALVLLSASAVSLRGLGGNFFAAPASVDTSRTALGAGLGTGTAAAGLLITCVSQFLVFPIGCVVKDCTPDPASTWATILPNVLLLVTGVGIFPWGLGKRESVSLSRAGRGVGAILGGLVLLVFGFSVGYSPYCAAAGCQAPTLKGWWLIYWPDIIAELGGLGLIIAGSATLQIDRDQTDG